MTFSDYIDYLHGKRIGVIGFGVSNQPLVRVLLPGGGAGRGGDGGGRGRRAPPGHGGAAERAMFALGADYSSIWTLMLSSARRACCRSYRSCARLRKTARSSPPRWRHSATSVRAVSLPSLAATAKPRPRPSRLSSCTRRGTPCTSAATSARRSLIVSRTSGRTDFACSRLSSFQLHSMHCAPDVAIIRTFRRTIWMWIRSLRTMCQPSAAFTVVSGRTA